MEVSKAWQFGRNSETFWSHLRVSRSDCPFHGEEQNISRTVLDVGRPRLAHDALVGEFSQSFYAC